jgi:hippurate hydrolase
VPESLEKALRETIVATLPRIVELRHELHAHPQVAFEETYAAGVIQRELKELEIPFTSGLADTGAVAWLLPEAGRTGPGVALRADLDALPIQEETGLAHASTIPGRMHACGHDGHTAVLLGTARVLARLRDWLRHPVKLLFQPAEEIGAGAERLIEGGALDERTGGFRVGRVFGLHGWPDLPLGVIATRPGPLMASTDLFTVTVRGKGGHGSTPQATVDPIVTAAHLVVAIQSIVSRNVSPLEPAVISVGALHAGDAANVIPESAVLRGTIRAHDDVTAEQIQARLRSIVEHGARALGAEASVSLKRICHPTWNHEDAIGSLRAALEGTPLGGQFRLLESPVMASEDFSCYARRVPACMFFLGLRPEDGAGHPGLHTPRFDFPDAVLATGVETFCRLALAGE